MSYKISFVEMGENAENSIWCARNIIVLPSLPCNHDGYEAIETDLENRSCYRIYIV